MSVLYQSDGVIVCGQTVSDNATSGGRAVGDNVTSGGKAVSDNAISGGRDVNDSVAVRRERYGRWERKNGGNMCSG